MGVLGLIIVVEDTTEAPAATAAPALTVDAEATPAHANTDTTMEEVLTTDALTVNRAVANGRIAIEATTEEKENAGIATTWPIAITHDTTAPPITTVTETETADPATATTTAAARCETICSMATTATTAGIQTAAQATTTTTMWLTATIHTAITLTRRDTAVVEMFSAMVAVAAAAAAAGEANELDSGIARGRETETETETEITIRIPTASPTRVPIDMAHSREMVEIVCAVSFLAEGYCGSSVIVTNID
jgi:hypothetical protein